MEMLASSLGAVCFTYESAGSALFALALNAPTHRLQSIHTANTAINRVLIVFFKILPPYSLALFNFNKSFILCQSPLVCVTGELTLF